MQLLYFELILLIIFIYYVQKKIRAYLKHREKLKNHGVEYERKREIFEIKLEEKEIIQGILENKCFK